MFQTLNCDLLLVVAVVVYFEALLNKNNGLTWVRGSAAVVVCLRERDLG